jgi:hypothetical protein
MSLPVREAERRIGLLLTGYYGPLRDLQREELLAASEAAELLSAVLALVALLEREDAGRGGPEETFDIRFVIWDAVEDLTRRARQKRVQIELSLPSTALPTTGWRAAIRAVLRFALREHLHAVPKGGRILLSGEVEGGEVSLRLDRRDPGGRATGKPAHSAALALARVLLEKRGGGLRIHSDGTAWRVRLRAGEGTTPVRPPNG